MKFRVVLLAVIGILCVASPAQADWHEASSDHFVIYADDSEQDIRRFAENLERYHSAMEFVTGRELGKPSPSSRLVVFVVGGRGDMREISGDRSGTVAGFYVPRAGASRAFVQNIRNRTGEPDFSMIILLHEYAHHFLISSTPFAMPRWVNEGAAEFFASASFESDGSVGIGRPAMHRRGEFIYASDVEVEELLDPELYDKRKSSRYDAFYGRSWLLYHYLHLSGERTGQMRDYLQGMLDGLTSIEAARAAFGDLEELQEELDRYLIQRTMSFVRLAPERISIGPVAIRALPEGEAKMMDVRIRSQRGVTREEAQEILIDARKIARKYPDDPGVLTALAEAEYDAGNDDPAIAAADRALALDPNRPNAYVQKGFALFRKAEEADDRAAAYSESVAALSALNWIENDHPIPLIYYHRSFVTQGKPPTETARAALERASELAPFDQALAMNTALMLAGEGKIAFARAKLAPLAADPHGGAMAEAAREHALALAEIEEGTAWSPPLEIATERAVEVVAEPTDDAEEGADESDTSQAN